MQKQTRRYLKLLFEKLETQVSSFYSRLLQEACPAP